MSQPIANKVVWEYVGSSVTSPESNTTRKEVFIDEYDEQIQFLAANGNELSHIDFKLFLDNGKTVTGTTDNEGKTPRIYTQGPRDFIKVELSACSNSCCASESESELEKITISLKNVATNPIDVDTSVKVVETPEGDSRSLTSGEIEMAKLVFADSIDYSKVKVHRGGYWLFFGFQDKNTAVTPNGEMYFPGDTFKEDYSTLSDSQQAWFMHEMTHVWQYQLDYPIKWVRGPRPNMSYDYTLSPDKKLRDFNMEAQGDILRDYFLVAFRGNTKDLSEKKYRYIPASETLSQLNLTLSDFTANPKDKKNLPNTTENEK